MKQKVRDPNLRKGLLSQFHSKRFFESPCNDYLNHLLQFQPYNTSLFESPQVTVERLQVATGLVTEEEEPPECRICGGGTEAEGRWPGKPQRNEGGCILSFIDTIVTAVWLKFHGFLAWFIYNYKSIHTNFLHLSSTYNRPIHPAMVRMENWSSHVVSWLW